MTSQEIEQMKQVLEYLKGSPEERKTALDIVLPYSGTVETRKIFSGTEAVNYLVKLVHSENPSLLVVLKCLINFAEDRLSVEKMCKNNVAQRVYDVLKDNVK